MENSYYKIGKNIYWVGSKENANELQCNPYLITDGNEGVLIDPGSVLDFDAVCSNVSEIIDINKIKYIILQHQDPDICSSTPLFEKIIPDLQIVTHWRAALLIEYYGVKSPFYLINNNDYQLKLSSGEILKFIPTPYLHFPGAFTTYYEEEKTLFSSDLFGAVRNKWELFADESYIETAKTFHEHYMPGNNILRPVMEIFESLNISQIAPQHGSIIRNENNLAERLINVLKNLECGSLLEPVKKIAFEEKGYAGLCSDVIERYISTYSLEEVLEIFKSGEIRLSESGKIADFSMTGIELWEYFFKTIFNKKGYEWLSIVEVYIQNISKIYNIEMPSLFKSLIYNCENMSEKLSRENRDLKQFIENINNKVSNVESGLTKDHLTGAYNEVFFRSFIIDEIKNNFKHEINSGLLLIEVDNIDEINRKSGFHIGDSVIKTLSYKLDNIKEKTHLVFKIRGPLFAYYIPGCERKKLLDTAEKIRNEIAESDIFLDKITVSAAVCEFSEFFEYLDEEKVIFDLIMKTLNQRREIAKKKGANIVIDSSFTSIAEYSETNGKILIADTDDLHLDILSSTFELLNYRVFIAEDGETAYEIILKENPDLVISEIMIPKIDGFSLRERMLMESHLKDIPYIITSFQKDDISILKAFELNVCYFFQKPYILSEIIGIVRNKIKERRLM